MKIHYLFFCFFIFFTCDGLLNAFSHDDIIMCAENMCELLLHGRLCDDCTLEKCVTYMAPDLQGKEYTRDPVINVIVNNEESEKFYAQKNFWAKIKNGVFVLKSLVVLAIVLVILYLLYRGYDTFFEWPPDKQYPSSQLQEGGDGTMSMDVQGYGGMDQRDNGDVTQKEQEQEQEQEKNQSINSQGSEALNHVGTQESGAGGNQPNQDAVSPKQQEKEQSKEKNQPIDSSRYKEPILPHNMPVAQQQEGDPKNQGAPSLPKQNIVWVLGEPQVSFYVDLLARTEKKIEQAKSIGLVSTITQSDILWILAHPTMPNEWPYGKTTDDQIIYAKNIGLEPAIDYAVHFRASQ